jgi:hypothetical protein
MNDPLITAAINARTREDIQRLEEALVSRLGARSRRYLGDRPTNWSALSGAVDPRVVTWERMTNIWDSLIEAEAQRANFFGCQNPAEAAKRFLGVPLEGPTAMGSAARDELAGHSILTLHDSNNSRRQPTLSFRDRGIGITPAEAPGTILSVEGSNKLGKPYLHGVYGKGGSVTCRFSDATVIVSRKQPDLLRDDEEDRVWFAVVRRGDDPDMRLPFFYYLVDPSRDRQPYSVPADQTDFEPGTLVLHVNYQGQRMGEQQWQFEESIYAWAETLLFRPTLPYRLHDARSDEANVRPPDRRKPATLMGLGQRLDALEKKDGLLDRGGPIRIPVPGVGEVGMRWFLLDSEDRRRRRAAKGNVALFITGGQVHHAWDTARFIGMVEGRRRVARKILVEIDTDPIPFKTRVTIFSSFRETMLKSPEAAALERAVAEWLANDPDLADAESQFTRQALRSGGEKVSLALRQRMNRAIRTKLPGLAGAAGGAAPQSRPPKPKPVDDLYAEPTAFTGPEEIQVLPGMRRVFYMQANAKDRFIPDLGEIELVAPPSAPAFEFGKGDLRRGRIQLSLFAPASAPLGDYELEVQLSWMRSAGGVETVSWPVKVRVVDEIAAPKPPPGRGGRKKSSAGEVAFVWSDAEKEASWDDTVVGELQWIKGDDLAATHPETYSDLKGVDDTVPTVVLNERLREFHAYIKGIAPDASDDALEVRREKYALAVGVVVASIYAQEDRLTKAYQRWKESENGGEEPEKPMTEAQIRRALAQHARGVLALMPDFDQLLGDVGTETVVPGAD